VVCEVHHPHQFQCILIGNRSANGNLFIHVTLIANLKNDMSNTYFCFSDECGDYRPSMTDKQKKIHPFYIRSTLIINSKEWKSLNLKFREVKVKYGIPIVKEVKWAHVWQLRNFKKQNKVIPDSHEIKFLEDLDYHKLIDFLSEALTLVNTLNEKIIICTYTKNAIGYNTNEKSMLSFHIQEHMQRIEMELKKDESNLGVLFFDPVSTDKNEMFRQIYNELYMNGDFIEEYQFIKDSLNIENSHHSVGIQIADYISGAFSSLLKTSGNNDYEKGVDMFFESIYPNLRRSYDGSIQGYGIREVTTNYPLRKWLLLKISELRGKYDEKISL
jgi:hypothetical protein